MNTNHAVHIGILEYVCHWPNLYASSEIFLTSKTKVTIFTKKDIWDKIKEDISDVGRYNIIFKHENETVLQFLNRVEKICDESKIDILFIQTISERIRKIRDFKDFNPKCKIILNLHAINAWLDNKNPRWWKNFWRTPHVGHNIFFIFWFLIDTMLTSRFINKIILKKVDAYGVQTSPIAGHAGLLGVKKPVFVIPGWFNTEKKERKTRKNQSNPNEAITFIVPGSLSKTRRDYELVFNVFEDILRRYRKKVRLILLGRPIGRYGEEVVRKAKKLSSEGLDIVYFEEFMPGNEFHRWLESGDFILAPMRLETWSANVIWEIAGETKSSSCLETSIIHKLPLIVPKGYTVPSKLKTSTLKYDGNEGLKRLVEDIIRNPKQISILAIEAEKNAEKYSLPILHNYVNEKILKDLGFS